MQRCSEKAWSMCPTRHLCGPIEEATFTDDCECAVFNQSVEDKPMTNAGRIRSMSDEELENGIRKLSVGYEPWCDRHCKMNGDDNCNRCLRIWLQKPAERG